MFFKNIHFPTFLRSKLTHFAFVFVAFALLLSACTPNNPIVQLPNLAQANSDATPEATAIPSPARPKYKPAELVDYIAQTGDTLPALAARFNTSVEEIQEANPIIPSDVTTLPPGMPMQIPIYYLPLWGSQLQILPDHAFVNGPSSVGFDTQAFVDAYPGWLKEQSDYVGGEKRSGAGIVDYVATNFSVSPRLLLALLEYQAGALTNPKAPNSPYALGYEDPIGHRGLYLQLVWAANTLNNGYYGWRSGSLLEFDLTDSSLERPDPWQNAATVGIQYYFARTLPKSAYEYVIGIEGLRSTYQNLFGDVWMDEQILIPGSLEQPELLLPFPRGDTWTYTGAPHTGWGKGRPYAGIDFAPPSTQSGCFVAGANDYTTAMGSGMVTRVAPGVVILDLDADGDERTGWVILYLHVATNGRVPLGTLLNAGDLIGYPSCEGGRTTGTHIHIARKFNGEWMPADSAVPFDMEGWLPKNGAYEYAGTLIRDGFVVRASPVSDIYSSVTAGE